MASKRKQEWTSGRAAAKAAVLKRFADGVPDGWDVIAYYDSERAPCLCATHDIVGILCTAVATEPIATRKKLAKGIRCKCLNCGKRWKYTGERYTPLPRMSKAHRLGLIRQRARRVS